MLNTQFIGLNLYFAVNLLAALVCFAVFWLIFDAWTVRHPRVELLKWAGFLALSVGFLARGAALYHGTGDTTGFVSIAGASLRLLGYIGIAAGQLLDPLQPRPKYDAPSPQSAPQKSNHSAGAFASLGPIAGLALPLAAFSVGALYWRRATTGLEHHLRSVAWGFAALTLFEILGDLAGLSGTTNPTLYQLVAPYGPVWWAALVTLVVAAFILGSWVWRYLTKRLQSQLFMILVAQTLGLFLVSTLGFTFLLMQNIRAQSLGDLTTASRVIQYAVASRQSEAAAQAQGVAASSTVAVATAAGNHQALAATLTTYLSSHGLTSLTITGNSGQILLRAADPSRWGDSASSDPLVRRALVGETSQSVLVSAGVVAPAITLVAATPIRDGAGTIVGTVTTGRAIDTAFVDGLRASTGLDIAVYGGNIRAGTTILGPDGTSRAIGVKEAYASVNHQVLTLGHRYAGDITLQNRAYLGAFTPLTNTTGGTVGMLLAARPADSLYAAANQSIQLTFLFVVLLIFISIYPVYLVSRFLAAQLR